MRRETFAMRRKRLARARLVIRNLIKAERVTIKQTIRFGPRYYVGWGVKSGKRVVFKICLFTSSVDHLTNEKFSREILFLDFIQRSRHARVKRATSRIFSFGIRPRAWYTREFMSGATQNVGGSVRFKPSFFSNQNLRWLVQLFTALQAVRAHELPRGFARLLYPPDFTRDLMKFMRPHWRRIERFIGKKGAAKQIIQYFRDHSSTYNHAPHVLAHQEPYADHLLKKNYGFHLIDWENVGWSNPLHDIVTVWMRASMHPQWQARLYHTFKQVKRGGPAFNQLWAIETMIQSVFNIISYHFYPDKGDLKDLVSFSKRNVLGILSGSFQLHT